MLTEGARSQLKASQSQNESKGLAKESFTPVDTATDEAERRFDVANTGSGVFPLPLKLDAKMMNVRDMPFPGADGRPLFEAGDVSPSLVLSMTQEIKHTDRRVRPLSAVSASAGRPGSAVSRAGGARPPYEKFDARFEQAVTGSSPVSPDLGALGAGEGPAPRAPHGNAHLGAAHLELAGWRRQDADHGA